MVSSNLKQLEQAIASPTPFLGALDLPAYVKECHVVATARCSLADVCAAVLGKGLKKHVLEWMSAA